MKREKGSSVLKSTIKQEKHYQHTLSRPVSFEGIGVHKAESVSLTLLPADVNTGIVFKRVDLPGTPSISVKYQNTQQVPFCSRIASGEAAIMTLEHLMAALWATELDNVIVEVSAEEVPILDGSSRPFIDAILLAGVKQQQMPRRFIRILKTVHVGNEQRFITLSPSDTFSIDFEIDFLTHKNMTAQTCYFEGNAFDFRKTIASARTFGFFDDAEKMRKAGIALGASLENVVVIQDGNPMNPEGFRFEDECVKHKVLDAVGDLYLCGYPILGSYKAKNAGHEFNAMALKTLLDDQDAWCFDVATDEMPFYNRVSPAILSMTPAFSA